MDATAKSLPLAAGMAAVLSNMLGRGMRGLYGKLNWKRNELECIRNSKRST